MKKIYLVCEKTVDMCIWSEFALDKIYGDDRNSEKKMAAYLKKQKHGKFAVLCLTSKQLRKVKAAVEEC